MIDFPEIVDRKMYVKLSNVLLTLNVYVSNFRIAKASDEKILQLLGSRSPVNI